MRVLIADDDLQILALWELLLACVQPVELMLASNGERALNLALETMPDLILLDVMMPGGLDGIEVCRRLREAPALSGARVIMFSASSSEEHHAAARAAGAEDYWHKPFDVFEVRDKIVRLMQAA